MKMHFDNISKMKINEIAFQIMKKIKLKVNLDSALSKKSCLLIMASIIIKCIC